MITNSSIRFNQGVFLEGITLIRNVSQGSCMSDTSNWKLQWKRGTPEQSSCISDTIIENCSVTKCLGFGDFVNDDSDSYFDA